MLRKSISLIALVLAWAATVPAVETDSLHPFPTAAPAPSASQARLDREQVHGYYSEGNFENVIHTLEDYFRRGHVTREDSLFADKHLGVVYAANPATREKGRYYLLRLIEIDSASNLADMYVGDEIQGVFDKVKAEYVARETGKAKEAARRDSALAASAAARKPARREEEPEVRSQSHAGLWITMGAGLVAAGAAAYYIVESQHVETKETIYRVTPPSN